MSDTVIYLKDRIKDHVDKNESLMKKAGENFSRVEHYGRLLLVKFFRESGFLNAADEHYDAAYIRDKLELTPRYEKLFEVLLEILQDEGFIRAEGGKIISTGKSVSGGIDDIIKGLDKFRDDLIAEHNDMAPHFKLLETAIGNYKDLLNGVKTGDEVLFPLFSIDLVKNIFTGNILADYFNKTAALLVCYYAEHIKKNPDDRIRILEIGSGTGGTSVFVLKELSGLKDAVEYNFTDISGIFVKKAKKSFGSDYPFAVFKKLDIEAVLDGQDFAEGSFDCIFASNVIHSTKNIASSLKNIYRLLKKGGVFILNEVTASQDFVNLTFGLMDGWWKFDDKEIRLKNSPLLNMQCWIEILKQNDFNDINVITSTHQEKKDSFSQSLILCVK